MRVRALVNQVGVNGQQGPAVETEDGRDERQVEPAVPGGRPCGTRTALEDRTLRDELEGYDDYARRVRFRLVPGIW
ncbi:MAG TPA: hypothetical protein VK911_07965 [Vicinamibacterales bacterium]|nr:hypothetical protein [Vicinamibacterales bacterium]